MKKITLSIGGSILDCFALAFIGGDSGFDPAFNDFGFNGADPGCTD